MSNKYTAILAIPELNTATVTNARKRFSAFCDKKVIRNSLFEDDVWVFNDEYAIYHLNFEVDCDRYAAFGKRMKMSVLEYKTYMKTFIVFQLGILVVSTLQSLILGMKRVAYCEKGQLRGFLQENVAKWSVRLSDYFAMLPQEGREQEMTVLMGEIDDAEESLVRNGGGQRTIATFESYFRFGDILKRFWEESKDENEKLFFFPIWLWWNVTGVLPLRPREFVLTPRNCLAYEAGKYYLTVRRNRIKGRKTKEYKISRDYVLAKYEISKWLADEVQWYLDRTQNCQNTELQTLFVTETHYVMWNRSAPYKSRYFTYVNLRTCLRYFYQAIIQDRYQYKIRYEYTGIALNGEHEIEYLHLGDTRHIALINMIAEGATPVVAMMLAGHDNPEMTAHYYSNIATLIECRTYRECKRLTAKKPSYSLSKTHLRLKSVDYTELEDGSCCFSQKLKKHDYSDCEKALGVRGEIGLCDSCDYHREAGQTFGEGKKIYQERIESECKLLAETVKSVRTGKGELEDITTILLRIKETDYSYKQYLLATMGETNGKKEDN